MDDIRRDLETWVYVVETLWSMPYARKVEWLALWPDLETAKREADRVRGGMIAT